MHEGIAAILEGIGSALASTGEGQDRSWRYVLGYFALVLGILALIYWLVHS